MRSTSAAARAFAESFGPDLRHEPAGTLVGLEHEYQVVRGNEQAHVLDTGALVGLGAALDPGDRHARRLRSGLVITADGAEAEVATPPIRARPGFGGTVEEWAEAARWELGRRFDGGEDLCGYSTHLSVNVDDHLVDEVALLWARTFAPAFALVLESSHSLGLYVRPRPGRLELCGEFADGEQLRAAAVLAVGSARACALALQNGTGAGLPPYLRVELLPCSERYGYRVRRHAFGPDLYREGKDARLTRADGGSVRAGEVIERAWESASDSLRGSLAAGDAAVVARVLAGRLPLPPAAASRAPDLAVAAPGGWPFSGLAEPISRPSFELRAVVVTWGFVVYRVRGRRTGYACLPRATLAHFLFGLTRGAFDGVIERFLAEEDGGTMLASHEQTLTPGLYDDVAASPSLLAPERPVEGVPAAAGWAKAGRALPFGTSDKPGQAVPWAAADTGVPDRPGKRSTGRVGKLYLPPGRTHHVPLPLPPPPRQQLPEPPPPPPLPPREQAPEPGPRPQPAPQAPPAPGRPIGLIIGAAVVGAVVAVGTVVGVITSGGGDAQPEIVGATATVGETATSGASPGRSPTPRPTESPTSTAGGATTATPSASATDTPKPTDTSPAGATATPTPTRTSTPTATPTLRPGETPVPTPTPSATSTATPTIRPTETPRPTATPTPTATRTPTPIPNRPPVVSLQANGSEPVTGYVLSVSDPEGDPLTILWNTNVSCGAVSVAITELSATWTHSEAQCGIHPPGKVTVHAGTVGVSVSDGHNPPVVVTLSGSGSGHAP